MSQNPIGNSDIIDEELERQIIFCLQENGQATKQLGIKNNQTKNSDFLKLSSHHENVDNHHANEKNNVERGLKSKPSRVVIIPKNISNEHQAKIKEVFRKIFLFNEFPDNILQIIISNLKINHINQGSFVCKNAQESNYFFIVSSGNLELISENSSLHNTETSNTTTANNLTNSINHNQEENFELKKNYKEWDYLNLNVLINKNKSSKNTYYYKCLTDVSLYALEAEKFFTIKKKVLSLLLEEKYDFINTIIFFKNLSSVIKHNLIDKFHLITFPENTKIFSKGDLQNSIYCIKSGSVSCRLNGEEIKVLGENKYFGIVAFILKSERTLDVYTREPTECFEFKEEDLINCIGNDYRDIILFSIFKESLNNNPFFFEMINDDNIEKLYKIFKLITYSSNEKINSNIEKKNLHLKRVILIIEGNLVDSKTMKIKYKTGDIIGEETVKNNIDIPNNLMAFPDCLTLEANLDDLFEILGEEYKQTTLNFIKRVENIKKIPLLKNVSENLLKSILNSLTKEKFEMNDYIIQEDGVVDRFYIITRGTVEIIKNGKKIRDIEKGGYFGQDSIINKVDKRTASVVALTNVSCLSIPLTEFKRLYEDPSIKSVIEKQMIFQDDTIKLSELYFIKYLGHGKFGSVTLVHNKKNFYAIKALLKKDANVKKRFQNYLLLERRIMLCLDHPFITKLVKSFRNHYCIFFLLEHVNGPSFNKLLSEKKKKFTWKEVRFYIASVLTTIEYIHSKRIIHRDIKPANIMIDSLTGYIKLIDFGTGKFIGDYTNTLIGSPHYMAPEILIGHGYSFSCDFWSIGIMTYEIFYGSYPFGNGAKDVMEIYNDIMYSTGFKFPGNAKDLENNEIINEFISCLLEKKIEKRVCEIKKLKKKEFFEEFKWSDLIAMRMKPPCYPKGEDLDKIKFEKYDKGYEDMVIKDILSDMQIRRMFNNQIGVDEHWDDEFE